MSGGMWKPCWLIKNDGSVEDWYFRGYIDNGIRSLIEKQGESIKAVPNNMIRLKKCGDCIDHKYDKCKAKNCSTLDFLKEYQSGINRDSDCCVVFRSHRDVWANELFIKRLEDSGVPICKEIKQYYKESED